MVYEESYMQRIYDMVERVLIEHGVIKEPQVTTEPTDEKDPDEKKAFTATVLPNRGSNLVGSKSSN